MGYAFDVSPPFSPRMGLVSRVPAFPESAP
jgi:hypothetical protein